MTDPTPKPPSRATRPLPRGFRLSLAIAALLPLLGSLLYMALLQGNPVGKAVHLGTKLIAVFLPVAVTLLVFRERIPNPFARADLRRHLRSLPLGIGLGLVIVAFGLLLLRLGPLAEPLRAAGPAIRETADSLGVLGWFLGFALLMSIAHAALEEYYWRWFVFGNLARALPLPLAHGVAALAFSAHHVVALCQFFPAGTALLLSCFVGIGGLIWSLLYRRQGTLAGAWASHVVVDLGIMAIGWHLMGLK